LQPLAAGYPVEGDGGQIATWAAIAAWLFTLLIPPGLLYTTRTATFVESYYAVLAWLVCHRRCAHQRSSRKSRFEALVEDIGDGLGLLGSVLMACAAYLQNLAGSFYLGLFSQVWR